MRVCLLFRGDENAGRSIEKIFRSIIPHFNCEYDCVHLPYDKADPVSIIKNILYCKELVKNSNYDVYHVTGAVNYVCYALPAEKTVLTIHDLGLIFEKKGIKGWIAKKMWFYYPLRKAKIVTSNSQKTKSEILDTFKNLKKEIVVIEPPIEDAIGYYKKNINIECPVVLQIGVFERKNLFRVIDGLKTKKCHLRIIGKLTHQQIDYLNQSKIDYSNAYSISDAQIIEEYVKSDIVIFASLYEGFGMPIIEAQAIGRPVITSDLEPMKAVSGGAAYLVNPYDCNSIANAFDSVINDLPRMEQIIQLGLNNSEKYRSTTIASKYQSVYSAIIKKGETL